MDRGGQPDVIFLYFAKAFDILKNRTMIIWMEGYLHESERRVHIKDEYSRTCWAVSGVQQGFVLGPALFIRFIGDMGKEFEETLHIKHFADNTIIFSEITSISDKLKLNPHLQNVIKKWCDKWQICQSKTAVLAACLHSANTQHLC